MTASQGLRLPSISRIVDELDGAIPGQNLYKIVSDLNLELTGQYSAGRAGESLAFHEYRDGIRFRYRIYYEDGFGTEGIPTHLSLHLEFPDGKNSHLAVQTETARNKSGATIRLYRRSGECIFPLWGDPNPWILQGATSKSIDDFVAEGCNGQIEPLNLFLSYHDGMALTTLLDLRMSVDWTHHRLHRLEGLGCIKGKLENLLRETHK